MATRANGWTGPEGCGATIRELGEEYAPSDDPLYSRVPDGVYVVGFVRAERKELFRRQVWRTQWEIVEGEHLGTPLLLFAPVIPPHTPPRPGYKLSSFYRVATGRRPPRDLWRRNPASFLRDTHFEARVAETKRDWLGAEVPPDARYSKITVLLRRVAGSPPDSQRQGEDR